VVGPGKSFRGRAHERAALDALLNGVRQGESAALVMRGEAGIGKTALMNYCARQASGCRLAQIVGVQSELEMPFAALHQLCRPMLTELSALPELQQQALQVAFGLAAGNPPDRFILGLAVLGLLAEVGVKRPLVCLVDDAQWLDEPSAQVLGFVGRRLAAEAVLLLLAVRETGDEHFWSALPTLTIEGLAPADARSLLAAAVSGHLDDQVRDRIVAETYGNPLKLLEISRDMSPGELAGGFGGPHSPVSSRSLEEHYTLRIRSLPEATQQLLLLAAADPTGDATLLWRAAERLGIPRTAADVTELKDLLEIDEHVRFRHPLIRSASYEVGTSHDRHAAHAAIADAERDPERRVWHLAAAADAPDEGVASQLEQAAATAQKRAGSAAAAVFFQRSAELSPEPSRRAERALAAAQAHMNAGNFDAAHAMLAEARALATEDVQLARIERLKGEIQYASSPGPTLPVLLVETAKRLESLDVNLARETYLDAWMASMAAGPYAPPEGRLAEVSRAARSAPPAPDPPSPWDLVLDGVAMMVTDGRAAAASTLRRAVDAFLGDEISDDRYLQWGHMVSGAAGALWDWKSWEIVSAKHVAIARASNALAALANALNYRALVTAWHGDLEATTAIVAEYDAITEATGIRWFGRRGALLLSAYQGRRDDLALMTAIVAESVERGVALSIQHALWTTAILCNGLGLYEEAAVNAKRAAFEMGLPNGTGSALVELIEAAVRSRQPEVAQEAMARLPEHTLEESDWAVGLEARSRALVTEGADAERWYVEAVDRLERTPLRTDIARAHLLYGEWLRREGRRIDARTQLASAHEMFEAMGAEAFAERARRELLATGEKVRKRSVDLSTRHALTSQEEQVARLARDGRSNAEIGAELFLSVRTVEWHLRKVFVKLGVTSRKELKNVPLAQPVRY
jgi:DNA-binding CsgD family transcriptional regulator